MLLLTTMEQFNSLQPGTKIYKPDVIGTETYHFLGANPRSPGNYIMLGESGNVNAIKGVYVKPDGLDAPYYTDYKECCSVCLKLAEQNAELIDRIFVKGK